LKTTEGKLPFLTSIQIKGRYGLLPDVSARKCLRVS